MINGRKSPLVKWFNKDIWKENKRKIGISDLILVLFISPFLLYSPSITFSLRPFLSFVISSFLCISLNSFSLLTRTKRKWCCPDVIKWATWSDPQWRHQEMSRPARMQVTWSDVMPLPTSFKVFWRSWGQGRKGEGREWWWLIERDERRVRQKAERRGKEGRENLRKR